MMQTLEQMALEQRMTHYPQETLEKLYSKLLEPCPLNIGDIVKANGNYEDEQLGQFAPTYNRKVTDIKRVELLGTSGYWVQLDGGTEWIDAAWFTTRKSD